MENNKTAGKPRFKVKGDTVLITFDLYISGFRSLLYVSVPYKYAGQIYVFCPHSPWYWHDLGADGNPEPWAWSIFWTWGLLYGNAPEIGGIRRGAPGFYGMERTEKTAGSLETICQSGIYHILCDSSSYAGGSSYRLPYVPEPNPGRVLLHTVPGPCLCSCYISHWETGVFRRFQWFD